MWDDGEALTSLEVPTSSSFSSFLACGQAYNTQWRSAGRVGRVVSERGSTGHMYDFVCHCRSGHEWIHRRWRACYMYGHTPRPRLVFPRLRSYYNY